MEKLLIKMATMVRDVDSVFSNYDDLCRLCATKTNLIHGIHMFEDTGIIRQIIKKVELCLPIQIHESDQLPKMICENCIYKLDLLYDFRDRSVRSETLLTDLFNELALSHMGLTTHHTTRDSLDMGHEIILRNPDMSHSLDNMDINSQSNHSIQNGVLVNAGLVGGHFGENLTLGIQHEQMLSDPYALSDINLDENTMQTVEDSSNSSDNRVPLNIKDGKTSADIQMLLEAHHQLKNNSKSPNLLLDRNATSLTDLYLLQTTNAHSTTSRLLKLNCNICNAEFDSGEAVQMHYETHFKKCSFCLSLFGDDRLLDEHLVMVHAKDLQETKLTGDLRLIHTDNNVDIRNNSSPPPLVQISQSTHAAQSPQIPPPCPASLVPSSATTTTTPENNQSEAKLGGAFDAAPRNNSESANQLDIKYELDQDIKDQSDGTKPTNNNYDDDDNCILPFKDGFDFEYDSDESNDVDNSFDTDNNTNDANDLDDKDDGEGGEAGKKKKWSPKVCDECGKVYRTNYKLREHMRKHTGEQPFKCGSCDKAFRSKIGLAQHEAKHTGQYEFSCITCGKGFQCRSYLMVHQRVHSDVKPYPCNTCSASFKSKQSLLDHTNRHLGVKPYMCDTCGRGFITKGLCKAHQAVHTGIDNKKYSCKICNKMFVSKSYLQTHMRIHTGEKPFMCEVCGKGFLTRVDLKIHSTMHTGEKSFVCEICGKAFARRDALRCHRRSHTGERPYSCDLCGQSFTQFSPMAIHKRLHTGERPYECDVCKRKFVSRSTMMVHAKKHKDKR